MNTSAHRKAALLYVLPVLAVLGIWYLLLFTGNTPASSASSTFVFMVTEGAGPYWFRWLLVLPLLCVALGVAHVSPVATSRTGAVVLLALGSALAVAAWVTVAHEIALFVSLPLVYGFIAVKRQGAVQ